MNDFNDDIFVIGCYPNTEEKKNQVVQMIKNLEKYKTPIAIVTHYPISEEIMKLVDFIIYDKRNIIMPHPMLRWHKTELVDFVMPYAVNYYLGAYTSFKNASSFLRQRFSFIHYIDYDVDVDFDLYFHYVSLARLENKKFIGFHYDGLQTIVGSLWSCESEWLDKNLADISSYVEWKDIYNNFVETTGIASSFEPTIEYWLFIYFAGSNMLDHCYFLSDDLKNKFVRSWSLINSSEDRSNVKILVSRTDNNNQIVFIINDATNIEHVEIQFQSEKKTVDIPAMNLYYYVFSSEENPIRVVTSDRDVILNFSNLSGPYCVFKFHDNKIICKERSGDLWDKLIKL